MFFSSSAKSLKQHLEDPTEFTLNLYLEEFWTDTGPPPQRLLTLRLPSSADPGQPTEMPASTPPGEETAAKDDSEKVQSSMTEETTAAPTKAADGTLPTSPSGGSEAPAVNNNNSTAVHNKEKEAPPVEEETLVKSDDASVSLCLRVYFTSHCVEIRSVLKNRAQPEGI